MKKKINESTKMTKNEIKSKLKCKNMQKYIHLIELKIIMKNSNKIYNGEKHSMERKIVNE